MYTLSTRILPWEFNVIAVSHTVYCYKVKSKTWSHLFLRSHVGHLQQQATRQNRRMYGLLVKLALITPPHLIWLMTFTTSSRFPNEETISNFILLWFFSSFHLLLLTRTMQSVCSDPLSLSTNNTWRVKFISSILYIRASLYMLMFIYRMCFISQ